MKYPPRLLLCAWLCVLSMFAMGATQKPDPLHRFTRTGKLEQCLPTRWIQDAQVLDDQNILFRVSGSKYYLNHLPQACPQLSLYKRFSYKLQAQNQLCNMDIITVLTNFETPRGLLQGASCGLGKFERLKRKDG